MIKTTGFATSLAALAMAAPSLAQDGAAAGPAPMTAQDLVTTRDDAMKVVGDIEDRSIAVGHLRVEREQILVDLA